MSRKSSYLKAGVGHILLIILIAGAIAVAFYLKARTQVHADTLTSNPEADSYVDSANPGNNYGTSTQFRVDGSPIVRSYVRFDVASIPPGAAVTKATLKIYANSSQASGFDAYKVADTTWVETTVNYSNAPAFDSAKLGSSGAISAGAWYSVDVTSAVAGNGKISFGLLTTSSTALSLGSRESANKPQLVVDVVASPTGGDTTPPSVPTNLAATAVSSTQVNLTWGASSDDVGVVGYHVIRDGVQVANSASTNYSDSGLSGSTTYSYTVTATDAAGNTSSPSNTATVTTLVPGGTGGDPVIMAVGDMVCGAGSTGAACKQMEVSQLILDAAPSAYLALGDVQYESGEYADFQNFYTPSYGRVLGITKPVIGNHEYNDPAGSSNPSQVGYWDYYNGVGNYSGIGGDRDKGYYSYDVGSWHVVALNSNCSKVGGCSAGSPQYTWLQNDLIANASKKCTLAYFHHPLFASGGRTSTGVIPFWQLLYDNNADVILVGHEHNYERFAPMDPGGNLDTARGLKQFIVGTGGRNFTHFVSAAPNSELFNDNSMGVLKMTLHDGSYDWQFVPIPGNTLNDSGTANCHSDASAPPPPPPSGQALTFNPAADASVRADRATTNYGTETRIHADNSPQRYSYLKFSVSGVGTQAVTSAKLKLYNADSSNVGGRFHRVADTSWIETGINWNNKPILDQAITASLGSVSSGSWYEVDITSLITGDGTYSVGIDSTSSNGADYSSREGTNKPLLTVVTTP